MAHIFR